MLATGSNEHKRFSRSIWFLSQCKWMRPCTFNSWL